MLKRIMAMWIALCLVIGLAAAPSVQVSASEAQAEVPTIPSCDETALLMNAGDKYEITITNLNKKTEVNYSVSDGKDVLSVDKKGEVTANHYGHDIVRVTFTQDGVAYEFSIPISVYQVEEPQASEEAEKTFYISKPSELAWLSATVSQGNVWQDYTFELAADIDLEGPAWDAIGYNRNNFFAGTFDGKNHTIRNFSASGTVDSFTIVDAPRHTTGLFGVCQYACVKNLVIENADFSIRNESGYQNSYSSIDGTSVFAGIVCGYALDSTFQNIIVRNSNVLAYTGAEAAYAYAGGIAGYAQRCNFTHCGNENGNVTGKSQSMNNDAQAGGIVGELADEGIIRQSYNTSSVYGGHSIAAAYIGGVAGKTSSHSSASTLSSIRDCYNQGRLSHSGSWLENAYVGGIVGYSSSAVNRCYNSGSVLASTSTVEAACLGGIVGSGISASSVSNSAVMAKAISGGTSNYMIAGKGQKENNLASTGTPGMKDANGTYATDYFYGSALYTEQLSWDFHYIWESRENGFPVLQYVDADMENDIQAVDEAIAHTTILLAKGDTFNGVTQNVTLSQSPNSASVVWSSSNAELLDPATGVITRQDEDYQVKVMATVSSGAYSVTKNFRLNILGTGTGNSQVGESEEWGLSIDDARRFVAFMRSCPVKKVAADDPNVQVLTGKLQEEDAVISTLANVMEFWEVPEESAYLKSQIGDVVNTLKKGEDQVLSDMVADASEGKVTWDAENGVAKPEWKNIGKMILKTNERAYDTVMEYDEGYKAIKGLISYKVDTKHPILSSLELGDKIGDIFTYIVKYKVLSRSGRAVSLGKISNYIKTAKQGVQLMYAGNDARKNAVKDYLRLYSQNREKYDSPNDLAFQSILEAVDTTNYIENEELLNELGETLYQLNLKFGQHIPDEYKVIIKCPVDVEVYDAEGKIVGRVVDNKVDTSILNSLYITVGGENGDEKTIHIQDDEDYSISLKGNDTGMMSVSVEQESQDAVITYDYNEIALEDGKQMVMDISAKSLGTDELPIITDLEDGVQAGEGKEADQKQMEYFLEIYPCLEAADGTVRLSSAGGDGPACYAKAGTDLKSMLTVNSGYHLQGFYTDAACTDRYEGSKMPEETLVLYAKFRVNDTGITITEQPQDGEYFVDEAADALHVAVENEEGCQYQWYQYTDNKENAAAIAGAVSNGYTPDTSREGSCYYFVRISRKSGTEVYTLDSYSVSVQVKKKQLLGSGTCGKGVSWALSVDGILTISGSGAMEDYSAGAAPWSQYTGDIVEAIVKPGVTHIGDYVFSGCHMLKKLVLDNSVTSIGGYILDGCSSIEAVTIPFIGASRDAAGTEDAVLGHLFGIASTGTIQYFSQSETSLSGYRYAIPDTLSRVTVTDASQIPFGAFCNCSNLKEITLNEGIKTVAGYACYNCSGLGKIAIPDSVNEIAEYALNGCNSLTEITIPFIGSNREANGTYDGALGYIFGRANRTDQNYYVQYSVLNGTSLSGYGYAVPTSLASVAVTDAVRIPIGAFSNLTDVSAVTLNSGITEIGMYAFYQASGLKDVYYQDWDVEWAKIAIGTGNDGLENAAIHYLESMAKLYGASLRLTGDIGVNFYYEFAAPLLEEPDARVCITVGEGETEYFKVKDAEIDTASAPGKTLYKFTCFAAAAQMKDAIQVQVKAGSYEEEAHTYSIRRYADNILSRDKYSQELKDLVRVMMSYGAASQSYLGYHVAALADEGLAMEDIISAADAVTADALKGYDSQKSEMPEGISLYGANLSLKSETVLRYHFTLAKGHDISEYTFTVNGIASKPIVKGGRYCIEINNIRAQDIDEMFTVTVEDKKGNSGSITYGALTYVRNVIRAGTGRYSQPLIDTVKRLYLYNRAAESYIDSKK